MNLILLFLSLNTFSSEIGVEACGLYQFKGIPKISGKEMVIIINDQSLSEIRLKIPEEEESKIVPYLDKTSSGEIRISKISDDWSGVISSIKKVNISMPDPLNPKNHSY